MFKYNYCHSTIYNFFSPSERHAFFFRSRLCDTLPIEFDSEFFLARWWRAYKGDEKALELKLNELIEHRRAFGYNENNIHEKCQSLEFARKTFEVSFLSLKAVLCYTPGRVFILRKRLDETTIIGINY